MKYVLLDNGHGSNTAGKCSPDKSILEYKYNRNVTAAIVDRLKGYANIKPILVVPELYDVPLSDRVRRINKWCALYGPSNCIMISCHVNAAGRGEWKNARGWSVWTTRGQNNSDKLATLCYNNATKRLDGIATTIKDVKDGDPDYEANFYIIKGANCPAILTESLFMDNKQDVAILKSEKGFNAIVDLHVDTILQWFSK